MDQREVVVITGASAGVGRATAQAFGRRKARIGLIARGREGLEAAKREVESLGGEAIALPVDVSDADAVERAASQVEETFGPINIWVNNAMLSVFSPIMEMQPDEYRRVTEVTYLGYVWGTLAALRRMKPRDRGAIVQVGSALAYRGIPLQSAYCAAKHAVQGFHDSLRMWAAHSNRREMIDEPEDPDRPDNLWQPVDDARDHGAHGVFDDRSSNRSVELELNKKRIWIAGLAAALLASVAAGPLARR